MATWMTADEAAHSARHRRGERRVVSDTGRGKAESGTEMHASGGASEGSVAARERAASGTTDARRASMAAVGEKVSAAGVRMEMVMPGMM
jgi:hypothetical protein